jgi:hypothetical protein
MCEDKTTKVVVSLGVGTALVAFGLTLLMAVGLAAVAYVHCKPVDRPAAKIFPQLRPPAIPKLDAGDAAELPPVNRDALREQKVNEVSARCRDALRSLAVVIGAKFPAITLGVLGDEIIDEPKSNREADKRPTSDKPKKGWQSTCPSCPNYRPPVTFVEVPRNPPSQSYPTYVSPSYPAPSYPTPSFPSSGQMAPSYPSAGGTWIETAAGPVWLPSGFAYEHDSGLLRNLQTGMRSRPGQSTRPPALEPYRVPRMPDYRMPEQPLLADDSSFPGYRVRPAVPDFEKRTDRKTGGYACLACGRLTVGDQWATQWTAEGTPISFMCRECWDKASPEQRERAYMHWYRRQTESQ